MAQDIRFNSTSELLTLAQMGHAGGNINVVSTVADEFARRVMKAASKGEKPRGGTCKGLGQCVALMGGYKTEQQKAAMTYVASQGVSTEPRVKMNKATKDAESHEQKVARYMKQGEDRVRSMLAFAQREDSIKALKEALSKLAEGVVAPVAPVAPAAAMAFTQVTPSGDASKAEAKLDIDSIVGQLGETGISLPDLISALAKRVK